VRTPHSGANARARRINTANFEFVHELSIPQLLIFKRNGRLSRRTARPRSTASFRARDFASTAATGRFRAYDRSMTCRGLEVQLGSIRSCRPASLFVTQKNLRFFLPQELFFKRKLRIQGAAIGEKRRKGRVSWTQSNAGQSSTPATSTIVASWAKGYFSVDQRRPCRASIPLRSDDRR